MAATAIFVFVTTLLSARLPASTSAGPTLDTPHGCETVLRYSPQGLFIAAAFLLLLTL